MIISTTDNFEGVAIRDYMGMVFGEVVCGVPITRDIFANFRDFFGGRTKGYEKEMEEARRGALDEMCQKAAELGADAVVGVKVDYEPISLGNNMGVMLIVTACGTGVKLN